MTAELASGWVRDGLIMRNPGLVAAARAETTVERRHLHAVPAPRRADRRNTGSCIVCGTPIRKRNTRCWEHHVEWVRGTATSTHMGRLAATDFDSDLWETLRWNLDADRTPLPLCPDCGCLTSPGDLDCPRCLLWAERDAVRSSWSQLAREVWA